MSALGGVLTVLNAPPGARLMPIPGPPSLFGLTDATSKKIGTFGSGASARAPGGSPKFCAAGCGAVPRTSAHATAVAAATVSRLVMVETCPLSLYGFSVTLCTRQLL